MSTGDDLNASKLLERTSFPNGLRQIVLVQLGSCYNRMGRSRSADDAYRKAISAELEWGGRRNHEVSNYIVDYAKFFLSGDSDVEYVTEEVDDMDIYERLLKYKVPDILKTSFLPLPNRSSVRQ